MSKLKNYRMEPEIIEMIEYIMKHSTFENETQMIKSLIRYKYYDIKIPLELHKK